MRQQAHIHTYLDQTERPAGPHRYISGPVASTRPVGFSTCQRNHVETYFFLLGYTIIKVERENTLFNLLESFLCIMSRQERTPVHFVQTVGKGLRIRISKWNLRLGLDPACPRFNILILNVKNSDFACDLRLFYLPYSRSCGRAGSMITERVSFRLGI